jgi:uncharacterized protein involved in exopolysaccharide biosynthesis
MNQNDNLNLNSDVLDILDLFLTLWVARKYIISTALIFAFLGGIVSFLIPVSYTATSTFLPQSTESGGARATFGGLAALAGINLDAPMAGGEIPPTMYDKVLSSEPFRTSILDATIWINGDSISYRSYLENQPKSVIGAIQKYTIGLPSLLLGAFSIKEEETLMTEDNGLQPLSDSEYEFHKAIAGKVNIDIDKKEGVVSLSVVEDNPMVAAQVAKVTEEVLQDWIIQHKIKNAKTQYSFIEKQFESKQKEFFSIQDQLAGYMDRNQNVLSATYLTRLERLQAEFTLVNTVYSELAKQKEQAAIQLSKDTPTFSVLDPVKVPKEKTAPKRSIYVLISFFMGLIFSAGWFLARKPFQEFIKLTQTAS